MTARPLVTGGLASLGVLVLLSPVLLYVAVVATVLRFALRMIDAGFGIAEMLLLGVPVLVVALIVALTGASVVEALGRRELALPAAALPGPTARAVARPHALRLAPIAGRKGGEREERPLR